MFNDALVTTAAGLELANRHSPSANVCVSVCVHQIYNLPNPYSHLEVVDVMFNDHTRHTMTLQVLYLLQ